MVSRSRIDKRMMNGKMLSDFPLSKKTLASTLLHYLIMMTVRPIHTRVTSKTSGDPQIAILVQGNMNCFFFTRHRCESSTRRENSAENTKYV